MKKFLCILFASILSLSIITPTAFASENLHGKVKTQDYKNMMEVVKEEVLNGASETELESLEEVQAFKTKYTEEQIADYVLNTEAMEGFVKGKVYSELVSSSNDLSEVREKVVEFEDGSFVVLKGKTTKVSGNENETSTDITPYGSKEHATDYLDGKPGDKFEDEFSMSYWGLWKVAELVLTTDYTITSLSKVKITSTSHAGTKANAPSTVDSISTTIVTNNAASVKARGSYRKTNGIVLDGIPIGTTRYIDLETTIHIHGNNGQRAYFYVKNTEKY